MKLDLNSLNFQLINLDKKVEDICDVLQVLAEQGQGGRASAAQDN